MRESLSDVFWLAPNINAAELYHESASGWLSFLRALPEEVYRFVLQYPSMKSLARQLFLDTLARIDLAGTMRAKIKRDGERLIVCDETFDLDSFKNVFLVAFGKASLTMAGVLSDVLDEKLTAGVIVTNAVTTASSSLSKCRVTVGGHPVPNEGSLTGAEQIVELLRRADQESLVIFLVSGGGSALVEKPLDETITLDDLQQLNRLLVNSGATIREINAVRKHLSAIKGGRLAQRAFPARQVSLYVSDVNPEDYSTIASGPTRPDDTTLEDVFAVIERFRLADKLPPSIAQIIQDRRLEETPKPGDDVFLTSSHHLIMDNMTAMKTAESLAREKGLIVAIADDLIEGHYRDVADELLRRLIVLSAAHRGETVCLISGGEVSCPVKGKGVGGRNQEFVLYSALKLVELAGDGEIAVLSAGTDGIDGISPATGAAADSFTMAASFDNGLDPYAYLENNDSYTFFNCLGDAIVTGPTGNNVRDLRIMLARTPR
jgi:glycerate-2-kinase